MMRNIVLICVLFISFYCCNISCGVEIHLCNVIPEDGFVQAAIYAEGQGLTGPTISTPSIGFKQCVTLQTNWFNGTKLFGRCTYSNSRAIGFGDNTFLGQVNGDNSQNVFAFYGDINSPINQMNIEVEMSQYYHNKDTRNTDVNTGEFGQIPNDRQIFGFFNAYHTNVVNPATVTVSFKDMQTGILHQRSQIGYANYYYEMKTAPLTGGVIPDAHELRFVSAQGQTNAVNRNLVYMVGTQPSKTASYYFLTGGGVYDPEILTYTLFENNINSAHFTQTYSLALIIASILFALVAVFYN